VLQFLLSYKLSQHHLEMFPLHVEEVDFQITPQHCTLKLRIKGSEEIV